MASAFTSQLSRIAVNSTNELNLKAQRAIHSDSLIFDKQVAGAQDFDTIYQICLEGYRELCLLDPNCRQFAQSLFDPQSKTQERAQMTSDDNVALDRTIDVFLTCIGSKLTLLPAVKSLEWLIRRFK